MPEPSEIQRDLQALESDLKKLEAEYNMFFSGRAPRPPWETRKRVEALVRRWDRDHIETAGDRFRFQTLQLCAQIFVGHDPIVRADRRRRAACILSPTYTAESPRRRGRTEPAGKGHRRSAFSRCAAGHVSSARW